jgi:hypothetical protein
MDFIQKQLVVLLIMAGVAAVYLVAYFLARRNKGSVI